MWDINMTAFISYRRKPSSSLALLLQTKLKADHKIDSYVDTTRKDSTQVQFPERLMQAIIDKEVFVCLLGDSTLESEWVLKEIQQAYDHKKRCIPIFQEGYIPAANPPEAVNYLLSFDGVHIFDVKNVYVDEAIKQIAELINVPHKKSRPNFILYLVGIGLIIVFLIGSISLYPLLQAAPTEEQREVTLEPTEKETDKPAEEAAEITFELTETETATDRPTTTEIATRRQTITSSPIMSASQYFARGFSVYNAGNYEAAIADYTTAIELDPSYAYAYNNRGSAYYRLGDYEEALADYNRAIQLEPSAVRYTSRGLAYYSLGEYDSAIADYTTAIGLDPNYAIAYHHRGLAYRSLEEYNLALADHTTAIELDPNYAIAYYNRGSDYYLLGNYEEALADYNRAIQLDPNLDAVYFSRGLANYELGNYKAALADWTEAERLEGDISDLTRQRMNQLRATVTPDS
jgi:tetratricopeptide (TPR) repeat protein